MLSVCRVGTALAGTRRRARVRLTAMRLCSGLTYSHRKKSAPTTLGSIVGRYAARTKGEYRLPLLHYVDRIDVSVRVPLGTETVEALSCRWRANTLPRYALLARLLVDRGKSTGCYMDMDKIRKAKTRRAR